MKTLIAILAFGCAAQVATAGPIDWTDWHTATTGATSGSATGTLAGIGVNYSGNLRFAQTGSGTNYWTEPAPGNEPYTNNSVIDNAPTAAELIALDRGGVVNTVTFDQAITNPVMAIVSQGQSGLPVSYDFDRAFTVLSEGRGYWGDGSYTLQPGDVLEGRELHAAIQFNGTFSSLSWGVDRDEYWHGFTFGLPEQVEVNAPGTLAVIGLALVALGLIRRRRA